MSRLICQRRIAWLLLLLSCIFLFLVGKLVKIQLFRSAELTELAVQQRARGLNFFDGRGDIQDRHGDSLLDSRQELGLVAFPGLYRGWEEELLRLFPDLPELDRLKNPPDGPYPFWLTSSLARPHPALEGIRAGTGSPSEPAALRPGGPGFPPGGLPERKPGEGGQRYRGGFRRGALPGTGGASLRRG